MRHRVWRGAGPALLGRALLGLALLGLTVGGGLAGLGLATLPSRHARGRIPGLSAPVRVVFNPDGVPWITAARDTDAAAALGFVHARDRMFQMEISRRIGSGTLAEIVGRKALNLDAFMRTLGLRRRAAADYRLLPAHTRALLEAYARGVNARIAARGRWIAPEFVLLGKPLPWTPVDSLLWGKMMTLYLSGDYRRELANLALAGKLPPAMIASLWPPQPEPPGPQAQNGTAPDGNAAPARLAVARLAVLARRLLPRLPRFGDGVSQPATASNEWAVDGAHSETGAPLLAGDPHLALSLPGIWYLARIDTPGQVLAGATAPGLPLLVLGRNAHIAWTFTTSGTDTEDVFVETAVDRTHYLGPDGPLPYATRTETLHVRGGADVTLTVRETRHGPVISDLVPGAKPGQVLAVAMAGLQPGDTAAGGLDALNRAGTLDAALAAAPEITSPNQNLLVADATRIGLAMTGRVPIRRAPRGDTPGGDASGGDTPGGDTPVDGASGKFDWVGFASGTALPRVVAPASGRLVNANERVAAADFPVFLGRDWYGDWRARRIRAMLAEGGKSSLGEFTAMQLDVTSAYAAQVLPALRLARPRTRLGRAALGLLAAWPGDMRRTRPEPLIFNAWLQRFAQDALARFHVGAASAGPRLEFVAGILARDDRAWCGGDCADAAGAALDAAAAFLAARWGDDPARWRWGRAHRAVFANAILGRLPGLGALTTRRIAADGDDSTVMRAGMMDGAGYDFDDRHAASFRGAYDLADLDRSRFVVAPGQSGNVVGRLAANLLRRWRNGWTMTLGPTPARAAASLRLVPAR